MAFQADGSYYVADGYANTRVVKFDKNDNYVTAWGERGEAGKETRPNYFNNVHGVRGRSRYPCGSSTRSPSSSRSSIATDI